MLGNKVEESDCGGASSCVEGLKLLPVNTVIAENKIRKNLSFTLENCQGFFSCLSGMHISGYEIHMGKTELSCDGSFQFACLCFTGKSGFQCGNIYGTYVHGFFDEEGVAQKVVQALAEKKGLLCSETKNASWKATKDLQFDFLAEQLRLHLNMERIYNILGVHPNGNN